MEAPEPRFFENENKLFAHLEWEAIRHICFGRKHGLMAESFPAHDQRHVFWLEKFYQDATQEQHQILNRIKREEFSSLDEFYTSLKPLLKPRARGKALKDKKVRTAQAAFQREQLGDAFIENQSLMNAARKCAFGLSENRANVEDIAAKADELIVEHCVVEPLNAAQRTTLIDYLQRRVAEHMKPDTVEAQIIDADYKNLYFMWGKIKRYCPKGDTFAWPTARAASEAHCSKAEVKKIMNKLVSLGAVTLLQGGKAGRNSGRAALYRREA